jgi:serine/threonine protein kinase
METIEIKQFSDEYDYIKELGRGSFGTVILSRNKSDGKLYAVKKLKMRLMKTEDLNEFINETKMLKMIKDNLKNKCPDSIHAVCYVDMFKDSNDILYIAMEYIHGYSFNEAVKHLSNFIDNKDLLDIIYLQLMRQTLISLKSIHSLGLVHSDIKSDNMRVKIRQVSTHLNDTNNSIVLQWEFVPIFVDFGLSCLKNENCQGSKGSPTYMSPHLLSKQMREQRDDIWSLGLVFLEASGKNIKQIIDPTGKGGDTRYSWMLHLQTMYDENVNVNVTDVKNNNIRDIINKMLSQQEGLTVEDILDLFDVDIVEKKQYINPHNIKNVCLQKDLDQDKQKNTLNFLHSIEEEVESNEKKLWHEVYRGGGLFF